MDLRIHLLPPHRNNRHRRLAHHSSLDRQVRLDAFIQRASLAQYVQGVKQNSSSLLTQCPSIFQIIVPACTGPSEVHRLRIMNYDACQYTSSRFIPIILHSTRSKAAYVVPLHARTRLLFVSISSESSLSSIPSSER